MHTVLRAPDRTLLSLSEEDLTVLSNAVNEICNGVHIADSEFETRLGTSRAALRTLLADIWAVPHPSRQHAELLGAWVDQGAVMVRALNVYGDAIELGETAAREFAAQLNQAIQDAS
jgi:hypothetical protein